MCRGSLGTEGETDSSYLHFLAVTLCIRTSFISTHIIGQSEYRDSKTAGPVAALPAVIMNETECKAIGQTRSVGWDRSSGFKLSPTCYDERGLCFSFPSSSYDVR